jgi:CheY-like chemotaxis protein
LTAPWHHSGIGEEWISKASPGLSGPVGLVRILVVDDNLANQEIMATVLRCAGYDVTVAADGEAGCEAVQDGGYDLVLMDLEMPVMGGLEAARRIRQLDGQIGRIPIVAMTARSLDGEVERCQSAGMDDLLIRPVSARQILRVVVHWTWGVSAAAD